MKFNFGFFGTQEHRTFNYKPRYYDAEKDALKQKFGHVDGSNEREPYVPGAYVKGSLRNGNYMKTKSNGKTQAIVGLVGLVLFFVILIMLTKFFGMLF